MRKTSLSRFEVFQHKRVMAKVRCDACLSQLCIPKSGDLQCMACEEAEYQASLLAGLTA
jgi:hypothetical protein